MQWLSNDKQAKQAPAPEHQHASPTLSLMIKATETLELNPKVRIPRIYLTRWLHAHWPQDIDSLTDCTKQDIDAMAQLLLWRHQRKGGQVTEEERQQLKKLGLLKLKKLPLESPKKK